MGSSWVQSVDPVYIWEQLSFRISLTDKFYKGYFLQEICGGVGGVLGDFDCKFDSKGSPKSPYNYSASLGTSNLSISLSKKSEKC